MADAQLEDDLDFIRSFCPIFTPCDAQYDERKHKYTKVPSVRSWNTLTAERSAQLVDGRRDVQYLMFVTGEPTGLFVLDHDRLHPHRPDHVGCIDGVEAAQRWIGPIDTPDTFTTRSIGGGYHKVYRATPELAAHIKNGPLVKGVLLEVLYNKRAFMYGKGCAIVHRIQPQPPPNAVRQVIIQRSFNTQINIGTVNIATGTLPSSDPINAALHTDVSWTVTQEDNQTFMLVPATRQCCVQTQVQHTHPGHSCIYVHRTSVVLTCFSHGKRLLQGEVSQRLRALFFARREPRTDGVTALVETLVAVASQHQLAREQGMVLKRISPQVPVYEPLQTYEAFVTSRLANHPQLIAFPRRFHELLIYMARIETTAFPFVKRDRTYLGFANGMLNLVTGQLEGYGHLAPGVSPRHYIDQPCRFDALDTPCFDRIFRYQLETDEPDASDTLYTYFLGLIGRLFYEVGQSDSFDVMPFVVGDTNTGKSTLIDIVAAMFAPHAVGVVDSSLETIFGLQTLHTKELIVSPEVPENLAQQLASDKFKKMVCGETVAVPIKHGVAETVRWRVPMLMCGNDYPRYRDERGSVSKRLAIFSFTRHVPTQDASLKGRIFAEELAPLVLKCLLAYRQLLQRTGTAGFWAHCPAYFRDTTAGMHESTDYLHMFLTLGHGDNSWFDRTTHRRKVMYFVQHPGHLLWMEEFKKKFYDYLRFRHPLVKHRWTKDYSAFKRLGYVIERRHMCRACKQPATRGCCADYSHANRSHIDVITNIECVETYLPAEECD